MTASRAVLALLLLSLALPATAPAADVGIQQGMILYRAGPGESSRITVGQPGGGTDSFIFVEEGAPVFVKAPCTQEPTYIRCPVDGVTTARFDLGDGDDSLQHAAGAATTAPLALSLHGDTGVDSLAGGPLADFVEGGGGNDTAGGGGGDDVLIGSEDDDDLEGGAGDDKLTGEEGNDTLGGGGGDDELFGSDGDDSLRADEGNDKIGGGPGIDAVRAGDGDDEVDMRDDEQENGNVACDAGDDTALLDPNDGVAEYKQGASTVFETSCEHIRGQKAPNPTRVVPAGPVRKGKLALTFDIVSAFAGTYRVVITSGGRSIGSGKVKYARKPRSKGKVKIKAAFLKKARGSVPVNITVTNRDSAGRTGKSTHRAKIRVGS